MDAHPTKAGTKAVWYSPKVTLIGLFTLLYLAAIVRALPGFIQSPWKVVTDDGRHFIAWLRSITDVTLFTGDPIADYFKALTPKIYSLLFVPANFFGADIQAWHIFFVIPLSIVCFLAAAHKFAALFARSHEAYVIFILFLAIASASVPLGLPRSFGPAIVIGALALYLGGHRWLLGIVMGLGANLYPIAAAVAGLTIGAIAFWGWIAEKHIKKDEVLTIALAAFCALLGFLIFYESANSLGPTLLAEQARQMPIFQSRGRAAFFHDTLVNTVLSYGRSGILPRDWFQNGFASFAAIVLAISGGMYLARQDRLLFRVLLSLLGVGLVLFIFSHAVAFRAHLPARYQYHSISIVFYCCLAVLSIHFLTWATRASNDWMKTAAYLSGIILLAVIVLAGWTRSWITDPAPQISARLRSMPADTLVAGFPLQIENVPAFSGRSIYVAPEQTIPYKINYLTLMRNRAAELSRLIGGPIDSEWHRLLEQSGIDVFLISARSSGLGQWTNTFPDVNFPRNSVFAVSPEATSQCAIASEGIYQLIDAKCFASKSRK